MSTSKRVERLIDEVDEEISDQEVIDNIVRATVPGTENTGIFKGLEKAEAIARIVENDLNNWIDIIDFRVYGENLMSIACEYRWTIVRWAENDMDEWLQNNGWHLDAHRLADTHQRDENQMEARYKKEYEGTWVYVNILVDFPERVFDVINEEETLEEAERRKNMQKQRKERRSRVLEERRN